MNKKILLSVIIIVILLVIIGAVLFFNRTSEDIQIDIEELGTKIVESGAFEDELAKVDSSMIMQDYSFSADEIKEIVSYQGSGATSEEIVILQVNVKEQLNSVKEKINTRIEERKQAFENYLPEEVFKIDNNLLETKGNYVIFCISNDSNKVEEVINNYIKGRG